MHSLCRWPTAWAVAIAITFNTVLASSADERRRGTMEMTLPIYRTGSGSNVVSVGVGTPPQNMYLTLSTSAKSLLLVSSSCIDCVEGAGMFDYRASMSYALSSQSSESYEVLFPGGEGSTLRTSGLVGMDVLAGHGLYPLRLISGMTSGGVAFKLPYGSSGFWGLAVGGDHPAESLLGAAAVEGDRMNSWSVGLALNHYVAQPGKDAGSVHWGGAVASEYVGEFNWIPSNASDWTVEINRIKVGSETFNTSYHYGILEPGLDGIYVPPILAEQIFANMPNAFRDKDNPQRWSVPCSTVMDMVITIAGVKYKVDPYTLIIARDRAARTCWSNIYEWKDEAASAGKILLGTSFLSGVYTVLHYSTTEQYVGLAGKPGSVNDANMVPLPGPNKLAAAIVIAILFPFLALFLCCCYVYNMGSFQVQHLRAFRRQEKDMMLGGTYPPPISPISPISPTGMPDFMPGPVPGPRPLSYADSSTKVPYVVTPTSGLPQYPSPPLVQNATAQAAVPNDVSQFTVLNRNALGTPSPLMGGFPGGTHSPLMGGFPGGTPSPLMGGFSARPGIAKPVVASTNTSGSRSTTTLSLLPKDSASQVGIDDSSSRRKKKGQTWPLPQSGGPELSSAPGTPRQSQENQQARPTSLFNKPLPITPTRKQPQLSPLSSLTSPLPELFPIGLSIHSVGSPQTVSVQRDSVELVTSPSPARPRPKSYGSHLTVPNVGFHPSPKSAPAPAAPLSPRRVVATTSSHEAGPNAFTRGHRRRNSRQSSIASS